MDLSIVTTMYRSEQYVEEFYQRICTVAESITDSFEIIFVNDGSPDGSLDIALSLFERYSRIRIIDLSRNFGHHKAIMTGLSHARGDLVFLIDIDLEEKPELLKEFYSEYKNSPGVDVVYGVQENRKGGYFEKISGAIFYRIFNFLSYWEVPANTTTARLMSKNYVSNLVKHRDREVYIDGLWTITGFNQKPLSVTKLSNSETTYTLFRKLALTVNAITSFSNKPLVYIFYMGVIILVLSMMYIIQIVVKKLLLHVSVPGYTSIVVSIWFLGGLTILSLGVVGIYLSKMFMEVKNRPYTVIRAIYEKKE
ncbi:MAG: glycosyltransferase family 2 protein [Candidatus Latescibacteria bacterium]|nr:glycosyltransferase family 2 protein [Candidatus Latescibacterota bacterium]